MICNQLRRGSLPLRSTKLFLLEVATSSTYIQYKASSLLSSKQEIFMNKLNSTKTNLSIQVTGGLSVGSPL